jgi:GNAT superfamily N-acetyltransferase
MLAVDPDHQHRGLGAALTDVVTDWIRHAGLAVAVVRSARSVSCRVCRRTRSCDGRRRQAGRWNSVSAHGKS